MPSGFADDVRRAWDERNRAEVGRRISGIPKTHWCFIPQNRLAIVTHEGLTVFIHVLSGGAGLNTYDRVHVRVSWPDGTEESLGAFSADDLKTPHYVPKAERVHARQLIA